MSTKIERVLAELKAQGLNYALVTNLMDVQWLSGFSGDSAALLVGADQKILITDFRFRSAVPSQCPDWEFQMQQSGEGLFTTATRLIKERKLTKIGAQASFLSYYQWQSLEKLMEGEEPLVPCKSLVTRGRDVKYPEEIELIRAAVKLTDEVADAVPSIAKVGMTEKELHAELAIIMLRGGSPKEGFDMIVASGPNTACCHAIPSDRKFESGDLLTVDMGVLIDGYHSDLTRTWCIGAPTPLSEKIYNIVWRANKAAREFLKPGVTGAQGDAVARDLIAGEGYGPEFGHSLGHGVGLDIHEGPDFSPRSADVFEPGNVVTIEPGIYIDGVGGVRIEDTCLVTPDGCETLSHAQRSEHLTII